MCPKNNGENKSVKSDCSIDQEREAVCGSFNSIPCGGGYGMLGYRDDPTADGACESLRNFSIKVESDNVSVGDYDNKTRLIQRFAGGSFGEVYLGEMINFKNKRVAVKIEPQEPYINFLLNEGAVYRNLEGGPGIPTVHWFGFHGSEYKALVMDLLGSTLDSLYVQCNRKFSMKTVLQLAIQMMDILAFVHSRGYVHRDISPSNFVIGGEGKDSQLFLIDFGHAKRYNNTMRLMPRRKNSLIVASGPQAIVGTPRFISLHAHLGHDDGPRDDLEALGYILVYLAVGNLPWQGFRAKNMLDKLNQIAQSKLNTPIESLCHGLPEDFLIFISYIRQLKLYEPIDYEGIKSLFRSLAAKLSLTLDNEYDWETEVCQDQQTSSMRETAGTADNTNITPPSR